MKSITYLNIRIDSISNILIHQVLMHQINFDRALIHHFNQSFSDSPLVIAARGRCDVNGSFQAHHPRENESKRICVEMQPDDRVEMEGVDFTVEIRYGQCCDRGP